MAGDSSALAQGSKFGPGLALRLPFGPHLVGLAQRATLEAPVWLVGTCAHEISIPQIVTGLHQRALPRLPGSPAPPITHPKRPLSVDTPWDNGDSRALIGGVSALV